MEQVSPIRPANPALESYLARIGSRAALGAPDAEAAKLWSDTAIQAELQRTEQAASDYAAIQRAKTDLAAYSCTNN